MKSGAMVAAGLALVPGCRRKSAERPPNVILISMDTTRVDRLGCYGYARDTTPQIDALAADAVLYDRMYSTSSWTLPAHASLFTGKFTTAHGARYDSEGPLRLTDAIEMPDHWRHYRARGMAEKEWTLAQWLAERGYSTAGVVGGPWLKSEFGLDRGFQHYDDEGITQVDGRRGSSITDAAVAWLQGTGRQPFFLFLNYFDPHFPYNPPSPHSTWFLGDKVLDQLPVRERLGILYDGEMRYMDAYIGRLFDALRRRRQFDNSLIIITADHGELLGEHGWYGHGKYLSPEEINIPLLVKYPQGEVPARRVSTPVQTVDVFPVIADRLDAELPPGMQGQLPSQITHPIISETYPPKPISDKGHWRAITEGSIKCVWNSEGRHALYNVSDDPGERSNLYVGEKATWTAMNSRLESYLAKLPPPGPVAEGVDVNPETMEALRGLGYIK